MKGRSLDGLRLAHVVCSDSFAGVERYVTYVAPGLARRGIDVVVIGGPGDSMQRALEPHGVPHLPARTVLEAVRRLVQVRPLDLVHAHMTASELAAVLGGGLTRTPVVATRHFAAPRGSSPAGRIAAVPIARAVRREIAISRFVADAIGRPSVVIPNGVPSVPAGSGGQPMVLMAQRLEAEKEGAVGIRAWAASGLADKGWRLLIAGEGAEAASLRRLAADIGAGASVDFVGRTPGIDGLLSQARVFLASARAEPFGLSVVEAMAAAVPVVASASGAHTETVGLCTTEWLFPAGDHLACAGLLRRLAEDDSSRVAYGRALQAVQRRAFELEDHVDRLVTLYREVTRRAPPHPRRHGGAADR